jgi:hypothetical protein
MMDNMGDIAEEVMGMTTIPIEAEVSTEQLLRAVTRLPPQEFAAFVRELLALRAQRQ